MKLFLYIYLIFTLSSANHLDTNTSDDSNTTVEIISPEVQEIKSENINQTQEKSKDITHTKEDVIVVEDESGLSDDAIREKAKATDKEKIEKVSVSEVVEALDNTGQVDISKIQNKWEELSPTPVKYDWVKTKSGEWFKGEIKAMYNDEMEFDSDEIGLYTFDFGDVVEIRSYNIISLNIENLATFPGVLRLKGDDVSIIQGEHRYEFKRQDVVSFAPDGTKERHFWSGKGTFSFDTRSGNTDQYDYTGQLKIQRRTANSHLRFDYLGRITEKNQEETANNHRLNQKYDRYLTRDMFWTPIFTEFYSDTYKNIQLQVTGGVGIGYTLIDNTQTTWSISSGPAILYTHYVTVALESELKGYAPAMEFSTRYEHELSDITDITYDYKLTYTTRIAGRYKHHMLLTLENELTSWLDLDITAVWDYILEPEKNKDGLVPDQNDFQVVIGLGVEF